METALSRHALNASAPLERRSESGSSPGGSFATRTVIPTESISPAVLTAAFCPAASPSNTRTAASATFFSICTCSPVNAVPCDATAVSNPHAWHRTTSICPSQTIASRTGFAFAIFPAARSKAYRTFDFLKMGVTGEFTYFPPRILALSVSRVLPENAMTRP